MTAMDDIGRLAVWIWQVLAKPVLERGTWTARVGIAASATTAGKILEAMRSGWAESVQTLGKKKVQQLLAESDAEIEKAKAAANSRRLAQLDATRVSIQQQEVELRQCEIAFKRASADCQYAEAEKLRATAQQLRMAAEDARMRAQADAWERFVQAASNMRQLGATISFDEVNLRAILRLRADGTPNDGDISTDKSADADSN